MARKSSKQVEEPVEVESKVSKPLKKGKVVVEVDSELDEPKKDKRSEDSDCSDFEDKPVPNAPKKKGKRVVDEPVEEEESDHQSETSSEKKGPRKMTNLQTVLDLLNENKTAKAKKTLLKLIEKHGPDSGKKRRSNTGEKKPLSAYNLFIQKASAEIRDTRPDVEPKNRMTEAVKMWNLYKESTKV
jgi:hypothetical protein